MTTGEYTGYDVKDKKLKIIEKQTIQPKMAIEEKELAHLYQEEEQRTNQTKGKNNICKVIIH